MVAVDIYSILFSLRLSACRRSQTAGRNSCSIVTGDVSNCSYRLTVHPVMAPQFGLVIFFNAKNVQNLLEIGWPVRLFISINE